MSTYFSLFALYVKKSFHSELLLLILLLIRCDVSVCCRGFDGAVVICKGKPGRWCVLFSGAVGNSCRNDCIRRLFEDFALIYVVQHIFAK
jgi:hypothetical protein